MASPLRVNPQPQTGWPSNRGFEPTYLNNWPVTAGPLFDGVAPISSGSLMDGWAAECLSVTGTMYSPQQPQSVYGNEFSAIPGGSIHYSMTPGMWFSNPFYPSADNLGKHRYRVQ